VNGRERKARKETRSESARRTASQKREIRVTRMTKEVILSDGGGAAARETEETKKRAIDFEDPVFSHCPPRRPMITSTVPPGNPRSLCGNREREGSLPRDVPSTISK